LKVNFDIRILIFLEAEKLCAKCAEKFSQETMSTKLLAAQMPLLITSIEVKEFLKYFISQYEYY
jgi:hypothetical protein